MDFNSALFQAAQQLNVSSEDTDLEKRLVLYQVFCRLYENNRHLLDEILELENLETTPSQGGGKSVPRYIVGMVQQGQPYLLTNLLGDRSQNLYQPECCWLIGRSPDATLSFADRRLSRFHAVIQYVKNDGFYLIDLQSTNGSFVNGEAVRYRRRLVEGDRIRVGSLSIQFYASPEAQRLPILPEDVRTRLGLQDLAMNFDGDEPELEASRPEDTLTFLHPEEPETEKCRGIAYQQSTVLDRLNADSH